MTVDHTALEDFAHRLLIAAGATDAHAAIVARALVASNLRGVDSHGLQLLPFYLDRVIEGDIDPRATGRVLNESGVCVHFDGANALGQVVAAACCDHASRLAGSSGAAVVVARDSNHFGAAAFWALRMAAHGHIGIVMCNASPLVPPWQGKQPRLGTNPICVAAPRRGAWLLDMATTTVAAGKIFKASINREPEIPAGWAMDSEGVATTSTEAAMKGLLMPLGGYKGSGLAMWVEMLCGVLGGGAMSTELGGPRFGGRPSRLSQAYIAIDVARFLPVKEFEARLDKLIGMVKSAPPASGYEEVLVAGEPEQRVERERRVSGIPLVPGVWESLLRSAEKLGVSAPVMG